MLEIDRLSLQVRAAAAPERAELLARRLRDAAVSGIERDRYALAPPGSPAYLFVERLAVHCSVATEWDDAAIGAEVARAVATALERSIALPQTVTFNDRAELLAAFYAALAEGRAWERWWFDAFDGLKPLPASAALRTSVMNEGGDGLTALARLTERALGTVLGILTAGDTRRLLEWLAQRPGSAAMRAPELWRSSASLPHENDADVRWLAALIAAERTGAGLANGDTLLVLRAMAGLRAVAARGAIPAEALPGEPAQAALRQALIAQSLPHRWCDRLSDTDARAIVDELSAISTATQQSEPDATRKAGHASVGVCPETIFTRRGGAFVLLKALDWLGWPALWRRQLEGPDADVDSRALALAVVARALEEDEPTTVLRDPALRLAFDVDDPLQVLRRGRHEIALALRSDAAGPSFARLARRLLAEFAQRIPGLAGTSPGYLRRNALALPATVERRSDICTVRLGHAPLDVLLVLAGAKSGRIELAGAAALQMSEDASA
jgi:hypothetical protein